MPSSLLKNLDGAPKLGDKSLHGKPLETCIKIFLEFMLWLHISPAVSSEQMPLFHRQTNGNSKQDFKSSEAQDEWKCHICDKKKKAATPLTLRRSIPVWWYNESLRSQQKKLAKSLECHTAHIVVIVLTLFDLTLVITDLSLFTFFPNDETRPESVEKVEEVFSWTSVGILSLFTIEQILKLAVFGFTYFYSFWHFLDAFVIIASLILEVLLRGPARETAALLVVFRMWRLVRVMHSVAESINMQHEEQVEKHHKLEKEQHQRIQQLEKQLREAGIAAPGDAPSLRNDIDSTIQGSSEEMVPQITIHNDDTLHESNGKV